MTDSTPTPAQQIAAGYTTTGAALELGSVLVGGQVDPTAQIRIPLAMMNRHGLVAGATGTGKTKTLQVIAEQLSAAGVPVVMADFKGDLSGLSRPGEISERIAERAKDTGDQWVGAPFPVEFVSLGTGGIGIPVRATISAFGPILLSKVLGLSQTQESSLGLIFHYADQQGLPLLDLKDLRQLITFLTNTDEGKAQLKNLGAVSSQTAGVILRALINLEAEGGDTFFGEPEMEPADLLRVAAQGRGIRGAERVELAVDVGVDPADEERGDAGDGVEGTVVSFESAEVGVDDLLVSPDAEQERHVHRVTRRDHRLDGRHALGGAGDLDVQVRQVDALVEPGRRRDGALGVVGQARCHLE